MKNLLCRLYQWVIKLVSYLLPWREPVLLEGDGSVLLLPAALVKDRVHRPLIITGPTLHRLGVTDELFRALTEAKLSPVLFDRVNNDPTIQNVEDAAAVYRQNNCDAIIAFGGGSPMDCAKLCGARIARPDLQIAQMRGMLKVRLALPPLYAVPTTSGTGSEVTIAAVVTSGTHQKFMVGDPVLIPRVAVLDPLLTVGMPAGVTAASGMDALSHAVEAYISRNHAPLTDRQAEDASRLIFAHLTTAWQNGGDLPARSAMQQAAFLAGKAFTRANVGFVHAIAHAVGARYDLAHGYACAVAMPAVLRAYGIAAHHRLAMLADALGLAAGAVDEAAKATAMIHSIAELNRALGLPERFAPLRREDIPELAAQAAREGQPFYPAPVILSDAALREVLTALLPES